MFEVLAGLCIVAMGTYLYRPREWGPLQLFAVDSGDDDIKIADGSFKAGPSQEDLAEQAAQQFLKQKEAGNIDKARQLGKAYANAILEFDKNPPECCGRDRSQLEMHHQLLLCSFVVNRVIGELSPNSILAQTSLNVFYKELKEISPYIHKHVGDMAAFSLYILCDRSKNRSEQDIGHVYAQLVGFEGSLRCIEIGNQIYQQFNEHCMNMMEQAAYQPL